MFFRHRLSMSRCLYRICLLHTNRPQLSSIVIVPSNGCTKLQVYITQCRANFFKIWWTVPKESMLNQSPKRHLLLTRPWRRVVESVRVVTHSLFVEISPCRCNCSLGFFGTTSLHTLGLMTWLFATPTCS